MSDLTREQLDREAIHNEGRAVFGCSRHPGLPLSVVYQDGVVRLLCPADGFEVARIKVAAELVPGENEELTMIALALKNQGIEDSTPECGVEILIERLTALRGEHR